MPVFVLQPGHLNAKYLCTAYKYTNINFLNCTCYGVALLFLDNLKYIFLKTHLDFNDISEWNLPIR